MIPTSIYNLCCFLLYFLSIIFTVFTWKCLLKYSFVDYWFEPTNSDLWQFGTFCVVSDHPKSFIKHYQSLCSLVSEMSKPLPVWAQHATSCSVPPEDLTRPVSHEYKDHRHHTTVFLFCGLMSAQSQCSPFYTEQITDLSLCFWETAAPANLSPWASLLSHFPALSALPTNTDDVT